MNAKNGAHVFMHETSADKKRTARQIRFGNHNSNKIRQNQLKSLAVSMYEIAAQKYFR